MSQELFSRIVGEEKHFGLVSCQRTRHNDPGLGSHARDAEFSVLTTYRSPRLPHDFFEILKCLCNLAPRVSLLPALFLSPLSRFRGRELASGGGKKRDPGNEVDVFVACVRDGSDYCCINFKVYNQDSSLEWINTTVFCYIDQLENLRLKQ